MNCTDPIDLLLLLSFRGLLQSCFCLYKSVSFVDGSLFKSLAILSISLGIFTASSMLLSIQADLSYLATNWIVEHPKLINGVLNSIVNSVCVKIHQLTIFCFLLTKSLPFDEHLFLDLDYREDCK